MKILWQLFISFFRTGLFTFGGGYAMLALLKEEIVIKRKWLTEEELVNYFAIGQCTPGIIAVNVSTFCGYKLKKVLGAITATLAVILPSIIIITLLASLFSNFAQNRYLLSAFAGIRLGVSAILIKLITDIAKNVYQQSTAKKRDILIFIGALLLVFLLHTPAVFVVLLALIVAVLPLIFKRRAS